MEIGPDTACPSQVCPACGHKMDMATGVGNSDKPKPGDVAICIRYAAINLYDKDLRLLVPDDGEMLDLMLGESWGKVLLTQKAIRAVKKKVLDKNNLPP